ncbi:MAG: NAD-dependent succinate-semialdehyde dehydrogenase [Trueperaceae bacterium]
MLISRDVNSIEQEYRFEMLIGGEWRPAASRGRWRLLDPGTEELIQEVPFGDAEDATAAVDAAAAALRAWSRATPYDRGEVLERAAAWIRPRAAELARLTTEESGKPLGESKAEWLSACNYLTWFVAEGVRGYGRTIPARQGSRRIHTLQQPLGVIASITAWNFPVYNNVRCWAAALAAGCTVVGRPSEYTPRSGMLLAQALHEGGAPPGVVNLVNGDPEAMAGVFLDDPRVRKIQFTGSPRVGRLLMDGASRTITRLSLELGGNAPVLVFPDVADVHAAARSAVIWKYRNCGQVCVAPQRFLVHRDIAEPFMEEAVVASNGLRVGHGLDRGTQVGPLINARQRDRVGDLIAASRSAGAEVLSGGIALERPGYFFHPTVVAGAGPGVPVFDEEIFGPVMPVTVFDDTDEALALANGSENGLAAFVLTRDLNTAIRVSEELEFGMVCINDWLPATPEAPFGGVKGSGFGRETGLEGLREYQETKTIFTGGVE